MKRYLGIALAVIAVLGIGTLEINDVLTLTMANYLLAAVLVFGGLLIVAFKMYFLSSLVPVKAKGDYTAEQQKLVRASGWVVLGLGVLIGVLTAVGVL